MSKIEARNFKGTRDYLPAEMIIRNSMINSIKTVFEKYGFLPLESPAIEYLNVLMGKYGEEGDKLIYRLDYKGGNVAGMKYDLTVPLARVISQHSELLFPFKRYQIQPVWRADRPQPNQGRFREFYQCDADVIGISSLTADAEIIALTYEILSILNIGKFVIRINNRKLLSGIMEYAGLSTDKEVDLCKAIDKLDKIGIEGVRGELDKYGFSTKVINRIFDLLSLEGEYPDIIKDIKNIMSKSVYASKAIDELVEVFNYLSYIGIPNHSLKLDLYLVRGLDYYTGTIYESSSIELPHIGSLTGGGRYDNLIASFGYKNTPAVGVTIGLDRIYTVLKQLNAINYRNSISDVLVAIFDKHAIKRSFRLTSLLRNAGIKTEMFYEPVKLKKQFSYANKKNIPYVVLQGDSELSSAKIRVKDLQSGNQNLVDENNIVNYLRSLLGE